MSLNDVTFPLPELSNATSGLLFRRLFETSPAATAFCIGGELKIALVTPRFAELHGYSQGELAGHTLDSLMTGATRLDFSQWLVRDKRYWEADGVHQRKDGTPLPVFLQIARLEEQVDGQPGYIVQVEDRSQLSALLSALVDDRALLLAALEGVPLNLVLLDSQTGRPLLHSRFLASSLVKKLQDPDVAIPIVVKAILDAGVASAAAESEGPVHANLLASFGAESGATRYAVSAKEIRGSSQSDAAVLVILTDLG